MVRAATRSRTRRSARYPLALLVVAAGALLAFGATPGFEFMEWDDGEHVFKNPGLIDPSPRSVAAFWRGAYGQFYMPLTYTAWAAIARVARRAAPDAHGRPLDPGPFHAANLAVHALDALLVFHVALVLLWARGRPAAPAGEPAPAAPRAPPEADHARRLGRRTWAAALGALVFAVHPLQAEAVAWVTAFKDVFYVLFGLAALLQLLVCAARDSAGLGRDAFAAATGLPRALLFRGTGAHHAASLALFALALLAKPAAVGLPLVAAALLPLVAPLSLRALARYVGPWLVLAIPLGLLAIRLQQAPGAPLATPLAQRPLIAGDALDFYLGKLVAPFRLSPLYDRAPQAVLAREHVARGAALPLLLGAALVYLWWRSRARHVFLYAAFVAALLPVLGLVPFRYQEFSTVADHYAYLAMAVAGVAAALGIEAAAARLGGGAGRAVVAAAFVVVAGLGVLARAQAEHWRTSIGLLRYGLTIHPRSRPGLVNLGWAYTVAGRYPEALEQFDRALERYPNDPRIYFDIGNVMGRQGRLGEAVRAFERSIALDPRAADVRNNLGTTYAQLNDIPAATREFAAAVRLDPGMAEAHNNLGQALAIQGRMDEAIAHFRRAVELKPSLADARANLEQALRQPR